MVKAVFFDLDGTLYDRDLLVQKLAGEQFHAFRDQFPAIDKQQFAQRIVALDDHGNGDKAELYKRLAVEWNLSTEVSERMHSHFWQVYKHYCRPFEDAHSTLHALQSYGIKLGVITNGQTRWQQQKLDALGIASLFDTVLISETEGVRKPDRVVFERALDRVRVQAGDAVFIGDNPETDIAGAQSVGMIPVWKHVPYWPMNIEGVRTVRRLSELLPICLEA
jgi:putative hydrolase of the HAD superfamily